MCSTTARRCPRKAKHPHFDGRPRVEAADVTWIVVGAGPATVQCPALQPLHWRTGYENPDEPRGSGHDAAGRGWGKHMRCRRYMPGEAWLLPPARSVENSRRRGATESSVEPDECFPGADPVPNAKQRLNCLRWQPAGRSASRVRHRPSTRRRTPQSKLGRLDTRSKQVVRDNGTRCLPPPSIRSHSHDTEPRHWPRGHNEVSSPGWSL